MKTGGPAFPRPHSEITHKTSSVAQLLERDAQSGMSLRDYFAAAALTGWIQTLGARYGQPGYSDDGAAWQAARLAYEVADAMLEGRDRNKE